MDAIARALSTFSATCHKLLPSDQADELVNKVTIEFCPRFVSRGADATYRLLRIRLNPKLWEKLNEIEREEIVIHEACHIICRHLYGFSVSSHGREWRHLMRKCGLRPETKHSYDTTDLQGSRYTHWVYCPIHGQLKVTRYRYNKIKAEPSRFRCAVCRNPISLFPLSVH